MLWIKQSPRAQSRASPKAGASAIQSCKRRKRRLASDPGTVLAEARQRTRRRESGRQDDPNVQVALVHSPIRTRNAVQTA
jgi:hypothetical protein